MARGKLALHLFPAQLDNARNGCNNRPFVALAIFHDIVFKCFAPAGTTNMIITAFDLQSTFGQNLTGNMSQLPMP